jgi:hypothetical protein
MRYRALDAVLSGGYGMFEEVEVAHGVIPSLFICTHTWLRSVA